MRIQEIWTTRLVLFISAVISWTAVYISYQAGVILAYNDATAHLNTARRVIDNLTPGVVQLGSVWLPLLHVLEIPFVYNDFLWQSGLSGAIISSASFIIASYFLYKLTAYVTHNKWAGLFSALIFATNLNLLYLQTTAMFEPLLMALAAGAVYFLTKWAIEFKVHDLIIAAFLTMLTTLTRYDGWALFLAGCSAVAVISFTVKKRSTEGLLIIFTFLAGFGIFLWFLYNLLIFNDPLYFQRGEYSAAAQQAALNSRGQLPTENNLVFSLYTYALTMLINIGVVGVAIIIIGLFVFLFDKRKQIRWWMPLLLLVPFGFNIITLYTGQSVIWLPILPPYFDTFFNARYGILMLPAAAFFAGYLASKHWILKIFIFIGIIVQIALFLFPSLMPIMGKEMGIILLKDTVSAVNDQTKSASLFMNRHYKKGLILVSSASADAFIFRAGIPLKNFITEGTGDYWKEALKDPRRYATWIVFFQDRSDRVGKVVGDEKILSRNYDLVYEDKTYRIFHKRSSSDSFVLGTQSSSVITLDKTRLWKYQCVDTMKTSRDNAQKWAMKKDLKEHIAWEMAMIKDLGANCVAIDTPYDEKYKTYLLAWVEAARKEQLHIWFRGNFASWEGWFNTRQNKDVQKFFESTDNFIIKNPDLFMDGDIFTAAPEAENGGPFNQVEKNEHETYRKFLLQEKEVTDKAFKKINKSVVTSWSSMNGGLAKRMFDKPTLEGLENVATIDHYIKDARMMGEFIDYFNKKFDAEVVIGEWGAPINEITGKMNEDEQAEFVDSLLFEMYKKKDVVKGNNYWTLYDSSTAVYEKDRKERKVVNTIKNYFKPTIVHGVIKNTLQDNIEDAKITTIDGYNVTSSDFRGEFSLQLPIIANNDQQKIRIEKKGYEPIIISIDLKQGGSVEQNIVLHPQKEDWLYQLQLMLKGIQK